MAVPSLPGREMHTVVLVLRLHKVVRKMVAKGRKPEEAPVRAGWVFRWDLGWEVQKVLSFSVFKRSCMMWTEP